MNRSNQHPITTQRVRRQDVSLIHGKAHLNAIVIAAIVMTLAISLLSPSAAFAYSVEELPDDNLIVNPWFRDLSSPNSSSLEGWTDAGGANRYWSSSQKESNPTSDVIIAGVCGKEENYCGTGARLDPTKGQSGGIGIPGEDAYLYQVVQSDSGNRKLRFFAHYVSHLIEEAGVSIYGGNSSEGPWDLVWVPLNYTQEILIKPPRGESTEALWEQTGFVEAVLDRGFSYYKVEIHARLPEGNSTGFKITGVYFTTEMTDEPPSAINLTTPVVEVQPEDTEIPSPEPKRTRPPRETETEVIVILSTPTEVPTLAPSVTPVPTFIASEAPATVVPQDSGNVISRPGFSTGLIAGGLIVLVVFGGVFLFNFIRNKS